MMNYKKVLGALAIVSALAMGTTAFAQTASTTDTTGTTATTPTVPNTGTGGNAAENLAMLGASALIAVGGAAYLARGKKLTA